MREKEKRGQNEGHVSRRADGRFEAKLTLPGGKRVSFYGKTRKEAWSKLLAAQRDLETGREPIPQNVTVGAFLDLWLRDHVAPKLKPRTRQGYESHIRLYLKPALGSARLARLTTPDVNRMLADLTARGLSPSTVQGVKRSLVAACNVAIEWGLLHRNPAKAATAPRVRREKPTAVVTVAIARRIFAAIEGERVAALYVLALATGARQSEYLALTWDDVDFDGKTVLLWRGVQRIKGEDVVEDTKSRSSTRAVPLADPVVAVLRRHRDAQAFERARRGDAWVDRNLVFPNRSGDYLNASWVTHRFQRLIADAGLPHLTFHDLRHGCASLLTALGVPPRVVMEILGHSSIGITMNTYAHVATEVQADALDRLARALADDR